MSVADGGWWSGRSGIAGRSTNHGQQGPPRWFGGKFLQISISGKPGTTETVVWWNQNQKPRNLPSKIRALIQAKESSEPIKQEPLSEAEKPYSHDLCSVDVVEAKNGCSVNFEYRAFSLNKKVGSFSLKIKRVLMVMIYQCSISMKQQSFCNFL